MFPSIEIESFFRSYSDGYFLQAEFSDVASLCEQWLLSFDDKIGIPAELARQEVKATGGDYDQIDRVRFAVAMALSIPSETTGSLIARYYDYITDNHSSISPEIERINNALPPSQKVDVMRAIGSIFGPEYFNGTRLVYGCEYYKIRKAAIVVDDVNALKASISYEDSVKIQYRLAYSALIKFPINPASQVYQYLIHTPEDEKKLFESQIQQVRETLVGDPGDFTEIYSGVDPTLPILEPGGKLNAVHATPEAILKLCEADDFKTKVLAQTSSIVHTAFSEVHPIFREILDFQGYHQFLKAVIDAGISNDYILRRGIMGLEDEAPDPSLAEIIDSIASKTDHELVAYAPVLLEVISRYTAQEIVANCPKDDDDAFAAIYRLTQSKELLEAIRGSARDKCFAIDLGL